MGKVPLFIFFLGTWQNNVFWRLQLVWVAGWLWRFLQAEPKSYEANQLVSTTQVFLNQLPIDRRREHEMGTQKTTIVRLILLAGGLFVTITGLAFGLSNGHIDLSSFFGFTYANPLSGIVLGAIGVLLSFAEARILYRQYTGQKSMVTLKPPES